MFLLSKILSQDPLEELFFMQPQQGGSSDNPTLKQFQDEELVLMLDNQFDRQYQWQRYSRTNTGGSQHAKATNNAE